MINPPQVLLTSNSLKIWDLRFSLDMERWLTPLIVTNQNLTENFKFKIKCGHGNMIKPPHCHQPESHW